MYEFLRVVIRRLLRLWFHIEVRGIEKTPATGPLLVVSNHKAVLDSFLIPAFVPRQFTSLSKKEHFEGKGILGRFRKWLFGISSIPVDRSSPASGGRALLLLAEVLKRGGVVALHPEGTRTIGNDVYRGQSGAVQLARKVGGELMIVPVCLLGTAQANPPGSRWPRFRTRITVIIGDPYRLPLRLTDTLHLPGFMKSHANEVDTRRMMERIAQLGGLQYVDEPPVSAASLQHE